MKVPARIAASWGVGTFATTTMLNGVSVVLLYFLVTLVKVEPVIAGALLFGSKLLDVFTDPLEDQAPSAIRAMYIGFIWIPVVCHLTAAALLRFYRLKKSDLEGRSGVMPSDGG
jgi:Na+/melibiose symporter-like transporter